MEDMSKQIAKSIFVQQSATIGYKLINNKRVSQSAETGFWLSLLFLVITHWPEQRVPEANRLW